MSDERAMRRALLIWRLLGVAVALALIVLPLLVATNLVSDEYGKTWLLFLIAAIGATQALFQPALRGMQRRGDWIKARELRVEFETAYFTLATDQAKQNEIVSAYTKRQSVLWHERADTLTEAGLVRSPQGSTGVQAQHLRTEQPAN